MEIMYIILDRIQFSEYWEVNHPNIGAGVDSPLWMVEVCSQVKPQWFVEISVINPFNHDEFWDWTKNNCYGTILCYTSGESTEWWGFSNYSDIFIWILRWA
jgi:hypothetical protein